MAHIRLNPKDAEKYGCPEVVEFDFDAIGIRQRAAVEKATGYRLGWMLEQLSGVAELDENGNGIPVPVVDDDGNPVLNDDGTPKVTEKLTTDPEARAMLVYLVLWGAGVRVPWDDFDVRLRGLEIDYGSADDSGKGEPAESPTTT